MKIRHASGCFQFPVKAARRYTRPMLFLAVCAALSPFAFVPDARATGVSVTAASGGSDISADAAQNAAQPSLTTLGNIVIAETATSDFAVGTNVTLILTVPSGWRLQSGQGSVQFAKRGDIASARLSVTASNITAILKVTGTQKSDKITIFGLKVQAVDGAELPRAGDILRTSENPGTAIIAGITDDVTSFGALSQGAGAAKTLLIQTQPSSTAATGVAFAQQPVIEIVDQFGNRLSAANGNADNSTVVTATHSGRMLQGTTSITASNGLVTFSDLRYLNAETITINFTAAGLVGATSSSIVVDGEVFMGLQLLVPGETAAPGTSIGKTGKPSAQTANKPFTINVNAVDKNWNVVDTATNLVYVTSTDGTAMLPPDTALAGGTNSFSFTFGAGGTFTITALDASDAGVVSDTSPLMTVSASPVTAATGGSAIPADTAGGTYTALTGPVYTESTKGSVGVGTIILNAPAGFIFDTSCCPLPTIKINGDPTSLVKNINNSVNGGYTPLTVTSTQMTFTVTSRSSVRNTLTWQNLRVRPTADAPLANGMITKSGTAAMVGVTAGTTTFGFLCEVEGVLP